MDPPKATIDDFLQLSYREWCPSRSIALLQVGAAMTERHQFEQFMQNYQDMVFGTALRLLGNPADAEDISQSVFLKAFDTFASLQTSPTAGGWLKTVTTNLCLNHLSRYRNRWRFFSDLRSEGDDQPEFQDTLPAADQTDLNVIASDQARLLESTLQKLPDHQRVPLVLYHFDDLSYEEIARQLKTSLSKVKTDIHRARHALRRELESNERRNPSAGSLRPSEIRSTPT